VPLGVALFVVRLGFGMFTPILPQYAAKLGIDATSLGFAYSLYNVALIIFLIPSGIMADHFGRASDECKCSTPLIPARNTSVVRVDPWRIRL
jgi:MFS family permease